jgi:hypothetical protein
MHKNFMMQTIFQPFNIFLHQNPICEICPQQDVFWSYIIRLSLALYSSLFQSYYRLTGSLQSSVLVLYHTQSSSLYLSLPVLYQTQSAFLHFYVPVLHYAQFS